MFTYLLTCPGPTRGSQREDQCIWMTALNTNGTWQQWYDDDNYDNNNYDWKTGFVQKSDCGFANFFRTNYFFFQTFQGILFIFLGTNTLRNWLLIDDIFYTMYSSILNIKWDSNLWTLNFRCFVSWTARKLTNAWVINSVTDIFFFQVIITVFKDFPDFSMPIITFKAFQGLENFYVKFQDFPVFSRICTNPGERWQLQGSATWGHQTLCQSFSTLTTRPIMHQCRPTKFKHNRTIHTSYHFRENLINRHIFHENDQYYPGYLALTSSALNVYGSLQCWEVLLCTTDYIEWECKRDSAIFQHQYN